MSDDKKPQPSEPLKPATRAPPKPPKSWDDHIRAIVQADIAGPQDSLGWIKRRK